MEQMVSVQKLMSSGIAVYTADMSSASNYINPPQRPVEVRATVPLRP